MALNVMAMKNSLPTAKSPFYIRGFCNDVISEERFIERMAAGRTTISKTDIRAVMQLFTEELVKALSEGNKVKTSVGTFYPGASGCLEDIEDSFTTKNETTDHLIRVHFILNKNMEREVQNTIVTVRQESVDKSGPVINGVVSVKSTDGSFRSKDLVSISGYRLKFDPADLTQGLFFVDEAGVEIRTSVYARIKPAVLIAELPELAVKSYKLVIKTKPNEKDLKTGTWNKEFKVVG